MAKQTTVVSLTLQEINPAAPFENAAPVIAALSAAPGNVEPAGTVTLNATATDANPGDTRTYAWSAPSGSFAQPSSPATTWTAPASAALVPLTVTVTVTDSKGAQGRVSFNVNVNSGRGDATTNASLNTWPQVGNISASATALEVNESTTVSATASDNDGDTLGYSWAASCPGTWSNATPTLTATVSNALGASATHSFTVTGLPECASQVAPALTVGIYYTLVVRQDGTVWTWGDNRFGQLGDGTLTNRNSPGRVPGLSGVTVLSAGQYHTVALRQDGTVWTWGRNQTGELGDGTTTYRSSPVQVPAF
ncbi:RCC1 domain-containing protein [Archangium lipolyticum]|uniref:RCC1 domain-containing protein n=1 Tax=Archangium lipolyticum TaxID=2970465 RepID=UPI00214A4228|nr:putative Ig domain-containing protein [Archangium lipolyticum]